MKHADILIWYARKNFPARLKIEQTLSHKQEKDIPYIPCHNWKPTRNPIGLNYRISSVIRRSFFLPKQSQRSRSVLLDGSRSLGLFRKGKIGIIAKFSRTDLVI